MLNKVVIGVVHDMAILLQQPQMNLLAAYTVSSSSI